MAKKDPVIRTTIRLPQSLWTKVKQMALDANTTAQQIVIDLISGARNKESR